MSIFDKLAPMVAVWKPTGREERVTEIKVTKVSAYGIMAVCEEVIGGRYLDSRNLSKVKVGDTFPTGRIVELRKHTYASFDDMHNGITTPGKETIVRIIPD